MNYFIGELLWMFLGGTICGMILVIGFISISHSIKTKPSSYEDCDMEVGNETFGKSRKGN